MSSQSDEIKKTLRVKHSDQHLIDQLRSLTDSATDNKAILYVIRNYAGLVARYNNLRLSHATMSQEHTALQMKVANYFNSRCDLLLSVDIDSASGV